MVLACVVWDRWAGPGLVEEKAVLGLIRGQELGFKSARVAVTSRITSPSLVKTWPTVHVRSSVMR